MSSNEAVIIVHACGVKSTQTTGQSALAKQQRLWTLYCKTAEAVEQQRTSIA
jgi:hypothetical protein